MALGMTNVQNDEETHAVLEQHRALLAVSEAIVSHRDLAALIHDLAGRLQRVVRFDYVGLLLHEADRNTLRLHVMESSGPPPLAPVILPVADVPAGWVWQNQQPFIVTNVAEEKRWPLYQELVRPFGVQSSCWLPLTTARRRLGTLSFASKQLSAYSDFDL